MKRADAHALLDALFDAGGIHRFTAVVDAAAQVWMAHERRGTSTIERWEDGPHVGAGMSDKVVQEIDATKRENVANASALGAFTLGTPSTPPEGAEAARRVMERLDDRGQKSNDLQATATPVCFPPVQNGSGCTNPHPVMPERGERQPLPVSDPHGIMPTSIKPHSWSGGCPTKSYLSRLDDPHERALAEHRALAAVYQQESCAAHPPYETCDACAERIRAAEYRGGITHGEGSPLLKAQSDFGRRHPARHMPPVDPTIAAEDPA